MNIYLMSGVVILMAITLSGCGGSGPSESTQQVEKTATTSPKLQHKDNELVLPAIWAKPYKMAVVNTKVCQIATQEDSAGCTIYDIQSIKTNIDWINQYYDHQMKKQYQAAFGEKNTVQLEVSDDHHEYYVGSQVRFKNQNYQIVTFTKYDVSYSGGAHHQYHISYDTFDLKTKKRLALTDILKADSQAKVLALAKRYNEAELIEYGTDLEALHLSDNFYLAEDGLVFVYAPYEIAAWVFGTPELFVPYAELKHLMHADYIPVLPDDSLSQKFM